MKFSLFTPEKTLIEDKELKELIVPSIKGYFRDTPRTCSFDFSFTGWNFKIPS